MNVPEDLKYTKSHEWVRAEGDTATIGITDHAQGQLSDVVFLELPAPGSKLAAGDRAATVESVKAASDIFAPVSGTVIEINSALPDSCDQINAQPYNSWMFKIRMSSTHELSGLLDSAGYTQSIQ